MNFKCIIDINDYILNDFKCDLELYFFSIVKDFVNNGYWLSDNLIYLNMKPIQIDNKLFIYEFYNYKLKVDALNYQIVYVFKKCNNIFLGIIDFKPLCYLIDNHEVRIVPFLYKSEI